MAKGTWEETIGGLVPGESHFVVDGEVEGYIYQRPSGFYAAVYPPGGGKKVLKGSSDNATEAEAKKAVEDCWADKEPTD